MLISAISTLHLDNQLAKHRRKQEGAIGQFHDHRYTHRVSSSLTVMLGDLTPNNCISHKLLTGPLFSATGGGLGSQRSCPDYPDFQGVIQKCSTM
jgi:hypothetical protein